MSLDLEAIKAAYPEGGWPVEHLIAEIERLTAELEATKAQLAEARNADLKRGIRIGVEAAKERAVKSEPGARRWINRQRLINDLDELNIDELAKGVKP